MTTTPPLDDLAFFLPGPGQNLTEQGRIFRRDPARYRCLKDQANAEIQRREALARDEHALFSALMKMDGPAARAAKSAWDRTRAGRQA